MTKDKVVRDIFSQPFVPPTSASFETVSPSSPKQAAPDREPVDFEPTRITPAEVTPEVLTMAALAEDARRRIEEACSNTPPVDRDLL